MITIQQIADNDRRAGGFYFSPSTLHFFGQTLEDFEVAESPSGEVFVYAPSYMPKPDKGFHAVVGLGATARRYAQHENAHPPRS